MSGGRCPISMHRCGALAGNAATYAKITLLPCTCCLPTLLPAAEDGLGHALDEELPVEGQEQDGGVNDGNHSKGEHPRSDSDSESAQHQHQQQHQSVV